MTERDGVRATRRGFFRRLLAGGLAVGTGILTLSEPPSSPAGGADAGPVSPDREPIGGDDNAYAVWQYRRDGDEYTPTAPINVVFPLENAAFADVIAVLREAGWHPYPEEYARYAWNHETGAFQLQDWTATETYFGKTGRYHVRCWELAGAASVQAHVDSPALPSHSIESYLDGQRGVESLFAAAGWTIDRDGLDFRNDRRPDHDGRVSRILAGESP